jgi:hypothetical protein
MARIKNSAEIREEIMKEEISVPAPAINTVSEKDRLLGLYKTLNDLNIRSIGDLENLIARTQ